MKKAKLCTLVVVVLMVLTTGSLIANDLFELQSLQLTNCSYSERGMSSTVVFHMKSGFEARFKDIGEGSKPTTMLIQYYDMPKLGNLKLAIGPATEIKSGKISTLGFATDAKAPVSNKLTYKGTIYILDDIHKGVWSISTTNSRILKKMSPSMEAGLGFNFKAAEGKKPSFLLGPTAEWKVSDSGSNVRARLGKVISGKDSGETELKIEYIFRPS